MSQENNANYQSIAIPETPTGVGVGNSNKQVPLSCIFVAEMVGMFTFIYGSIASVNYYGLSAMSSGSPVDSWAIAFCFGISLAAGICLAKHSGGHLNPGVSFAMYLVGNHITFTEFLVYFTAQGVGAILAALLVAAQYASWINNFENYKDNLGLVGMYGTLKNPNVSLGSSIIDQIVGSFILMFAIVIIPGTNKHKPLLVGATLMSLGVLMQENGFAFNMWRDLGPRVVSTIFFDDLPFTAYDHWFWVPMVLTYPSMVVAKIAADYYGEKLYE